MSLKLQVIKGIRWSLFGSITTTIIQFLQNLILARLLLPEHFGVMAMILVFIGFLFPLFDFGLSSAIIQSKDITTRQLSTLYWINILLGLTCFLLAWLTAPLATLYFEKSELTGLIRMVALIFLISPWGAQYAALLAKNLKFDLQNLITVISAIFSFILAIVLALNGFGLFTLIYVYIANRIIETLLNIFYGRKYHIPKFDFDFNEVKDLLRFGAYQTGTSVVNFLSANIDKLLIGKLLGPHALGLYTIAWNLIMMPLRKINPMVTKIAFPVFSKLQKKTGQVGYYYKNAVLLLLFINFPIFLFLVLNAQEFLHFLYGEKWLAASVPLSILAIVGLLKTFAHPGGSLILSKGRADIGFYWNVGWAIALFITISTGLYFNLSIEAVAIGQLLASVFLGPIWHWLVYHYGQVNYKRLLQEIFKLCLFAIPAFVLVAFVDALELENLWTSFFLKLIGGGILYVLYFVAFFRNQIPIILKIIK